MKTFCLEMPLNGEYMTTVRLTVGGLCALAEFDVDTSEDYKVCVTESLLILQRSGFARASVCFTVGETLKCELIGLNAGNPEPSAEDEISYALLAALIGKVDYKKDETGRVIAVAFEG
ncbi:MAG: hypothetical protein J6A46_05505 [Clostridia bacterium]|nr:hypothetical protein [Clostridia bacterium]